MKRICLILSFLFFINGCGNESGFNEQDLRIPSGFVRVVHAMPDAPRLITKIQARRLPLLNFGESTPYQPTIPEIERKLEISFFNGNDETIVATQAISVPNQHLFTVIIAGTIAAPEIITFSNEQPTSKEEISIQIFNASIQDSNSYDFFLTRDNEPPSTPNFQLSPLQVSESYQTPAASNYHLQFSKTGTSEIIWNSGPFQISETSSNPLFILLDNFGAGPEPVRVMGYDNERLIFSKDPTYSAIRIAHMIADAGPLDIYVEGELIEQNISFQDVGMIKEVGSGDKAFLITNAGKSDEVLLEEFLALSPGEFHTVALINRREEPLAVINTDSFRRIPQAMTLTVSNYSANAADVSVFVLETGQDPSDSFPISQQRLGQTTINTVPENNYEFFVYNRLSNALLAGPLTLTASSKALYRVYIADQFDPSLPIQLLLGDDLDPPFEP